MEMPGLIAWYTGALILGALLGYSIGTLFSFVVKPGASAEFWSALIKHAQGLLIGEDKDFWPHYKALMSSTFKYVGLQLLGVLAAFGPIIIVLLYLGPWIMAFWEQDAEWVVIPDVAGQLQTPQDSPANINNDNSRALILSDNTAIQLTAEPGSTAICAPDSWACLILAGFGFHTLENAGDVMQDIGNVIVRATRDDWNPLWPYLSDPEFLFFISLSLVSLLMIVFAGKRKSQHQSHQIGTMDNLMTQFATQNAGLMQRFGDFETKRLQSRLEQIEIDRPVFIAGLARSGTTIVLEKLASLSGVATHRYRDFPFIMTPVFWNRYLRIAGSKQQSTERPHQDGIKITRDSPDAFEEPIWQHFFPNLHDPAHAHVLNTELSSPEFERFYRDHLQKILLLRSGQRYVSKGNYNLPRIEYLGRLFSDALFVVPIRHPFGHIQSLVRQQQLFCEYAKNDPNSPDYLRAVGHYEFGEQRQPINIGGNCAERTLAAWQDGDEALGYAIQWAETYRYVADLCAAHSELAHRIRIIRFEDLCAAPEAQFSSLLRFTALGTTNHAGVLAEGIQPSRHTLSLTAEEQDACWHVVAEIADRYGYRRNPEESAALPFTNV